MSVEVGVVSEQAVLPGAVRLLVVDDEITICRQMASGLATAGFQVVTANDAEGAIEQANVTPPDVARGTPTWSVEVSSATRVQGNASPAILRRVK